MSHTIQVIVRLGEPLRRAVGVRRFPITLPQGATLEHLLSAISEQYPAFVSSFRGDDIGHEYPYIIIVNNRPVTSPNYQQLHLHADDLVHIILPVAGGGDG